jgi:hypothetical protein
MPLNPFARHTLVVGMRDVAGRSGYRTVPGEPGYFSCVTLTKRPQQQPFGLESRNRAHLVFANGCLQQIAANRFSIQQDVIAILLQGFVIRS